MFHLSSRSLYALRALYELARYEEVAPVKIAIIAKKQQIPPRFLEGILAQLKRGGFVESRRGVEGGYQLARKSQYLTIGEVLRFLEGPLDFVNSQRKGRGNSTKGAADPFNAFWRQMETVIVDITDKTTLKDLIEDNERTGKYIPNYSI